MRRGARLATAITSARMPSPRAAQYPYFMRFAGDENTVRHLARLSPAGMRRAYTAIKASKAPTKTSRPASASSAVDPARLEISAAAWRLLVISAKKAIKAGSTRSTATRLRTCDAIVSSAYSFRSLKPLE